MIIKPFDCPAGHHANAVPLGIGELTFAVLTSASPRSRVFSITSLVSAVVSAAGGQSNNVGSRSVGLSSGVMRQQIKTPEAPETFEACASGAMSPKTMQVACPLQRHHRASAA